MTSKACHLQMLKSRNKLSAQTSAAPVVPWATPRRPHLLENLPALHITLLNLENPTFASHPACPKVIQKKADNEYWHRKSKIKYEKDGELRGRKW